MADRAINLTDQAPGLVVGQTRVEGGAQKARPRYAYVDNLKTELVGCVILAHTTNAWTGLGTWVFEEPHLREPFLSIASSMMVGSFFGMALFSLIAGMFTPPSLRRKGLRPFLTDRAMRLGIPMPFFVIALSPVVEYVDPDNAG